MYTYVCISCRKGSLRGGASKCTSFCSSTLLIVLQLSMYVHSEYEQLSEHLSIKTWSIVYPHSVGLHMVCKQKLSKHGMLMLRIFAR